MSESQKQRHSNNMLATRQDLAWEIFLARINAMNCDVTGPDLAESAFNLAETWIETVRVRANDTYDDLTFIRPDDDLLREAEEADKPIDLKELTNGSV